MTILNYGCYTLSVEEDETMNASLDNRKLVFNSF